MFTKYFLALLATLFLGPGVGHLFIKQYKKGAVIIAIAAFLLVAVSVYFISLIDISALPLDYKALKEYMKNIISQNSDKMIIVDIPLAALWAYAFADIMRSMYLDYKREKKDA